MDNFFDSEQFCEMARAYNEKYNKVERLDVTNKQKLGNVLQEMEKLCIFFKKSLGNKNKFLLARDKVDKLEKEIVDIKIDCDFEKNIQNKVYFFSNKRVALDVVKVFNDLFLLEKGEKNDKIEILQKNFFEAISAILAVF